MLELLVLILVKTAPLWALALLVHNFLTSLEEVLNDEETQPDEFLSQPAEATQEVDLTQVAKQDWDERFLASVQSNHRS
jgi:hypothetical protein